MIPFEYFEPRTVKEATQILSDYGEKAQILAGGIDLLPRMQKGDLRAEYVVNIQRIPGLEQIEACGKEGITLGILPLSNPLEGIEVDIEIARVLNCLQNSLPE